MIVLDSCAIVDVVRKTETGLALRQLMLVGERAISCELVRTELVSVFRKLARMKELTPVQADAALKEGLALVDEFYPIDDLQSEVLRESIRYDHSAYDMFYFVLARRTGSTLFTLDRNLMQLCQNHGVDCIAVTESGIE